MASNLNCSNNRNWPDAARTLFAHAGCFISGSRPRPSSTGPEQLTLKLPLPKLGRPVGGGHFPTAAARSCMAQVATRYMAAAQSCPSVNTPMPNQPAWNQRIKNNTSKTASPNKRLPARRKRWLCHPFAIIKCPTARKKRGLANRALPTRYFQPC